MKNNYTRTQFLRFLIPSLFGAAAFMLPIAKDGSLTISIGILVDWVSTTFEEILPFTGMLIVSISAVISTFSVIFKPSFIMKSDFLRRLFVTKPFFLYSRITGAVFYVMAIYKIGPEFIWSIDTGGTPAIVLIPILVSLFIFSSFLISFLTDFGLMEYVGTISRPVMRPLFKLPGRAAIDCLASWIGQPSMGVVITRKMHEEGFYTGREASVISSTFSLVGMAYIYVMADFVGLPGMYFQLLFTTYIVGMICAVIVPRIWPLSKIPDTYLPDVGKQINEEIPENMSRSEWALQTAIEKAQKSGWGTIWETGYKTLLTIWMSTTPLVMAWATILLIVVNYTPIFQWISYPFYLLLELVKIPEAYQVAPAFVLSFGDQFLAAIIGAVRVSRVAKFMCAGISITGLVFMTEIGVLILDSTIPLDFKDLLAIYIERAILSIFILAPFAFYFC